MWSLSHHNCGLHGHRFEARYDEHPRRGSDVEGRLTPNELRELMITRTYVKDVCVRCGAEVKREDAA